MLVVSAQEVEINEERTQIVVKGEKRYYHVDCWNRRFEQIKRNHIGPSYAVATLETTNVQILQSICTRCRKRIISRPPLIKSKPQP